MLEILPVEDLLFNISRDAYPVVLTDDFEPLRCFFAVKPYRGYFLTMTDGVVKQVIDHLLKEGIGIDLKISHLIE